MSQSPEPDPDPPQDGLQFSLGLLAPPVPPPWVFEVPPPVPLPLGVPMLIVGAAVAVEALMSRLRVKRIPKLGNEEANRKVLKLKDAYEVIDDVCNSAYEIAEIAIRYAAAGYHAVQPHFPQWVDWAHSAADFREEVMNHMVVSLKDKMAEKVLQQENLRQNGIWSSRGQADIEAIRVRLGKLHKR